MSARVNLKVFLSLFLVIIIDTMGLGLIFPVLGPLVLDSSSLLIAPSTSVSTRGMLYGGIIGIFSLFLLIGAPLLGEFSDSVGRKKAMLICLSGTALSFFLCAAGIYQSSLFLLFLGRALNGFTAGSSSIAQAAIADISSIEHKTKNLGLMTLANCLGFVLGPIFGGYFADHPLFPSSGFATPFLIAGYFAIANIFFLLLFVPGESRRVHKKVHFHFSRGIQIFVDAIRLSSVRKAALLFLSLQLSFSIYFQFVAILLVQSYHYTAMQVGLFMTYIGMLFAFCLACVVRFFLRLTSVINIMRISFVIATLSFFMASFIRSELAQWLIPIPMTLSIGLLYTGGLTLFSNAVDKTQQGWVMGVSAAVAAVAWTGGAILLGISAKWGIEWPFLIAALGTAIGFGISLKTREQYYAT